MNTTQVRPWNDEDAIALYQLSMHPYYLKKRILHYLYPDSFLHAIATIRFYQQADPARFLFRAIVYEHRVCGYLQAEKKNSGSCELSYWLGVEYWHQGIMEEALYSFCQEIFEQLNSIHIYARVEKKNIASQQVLLRNGFISESVNQLQIFHKYR